MHLRVVSPHEAVSLIAVIVVFGFLAVAGRWGLVQAHGEEAPDVVTGMRLALGTLAASVIAAGMKALVYYSETNCGAGAPSAQMPPLCTLGTVSTVLFVAGALMFLASLVVWQPWRDPLRLQLVRAIVGAGSLAALVLGFMATGLV
jgi:hypothetical protein